MGKARKQADTKTYSGRIATRLAELIAAKHWSGSDAAERLGVRDATLRSWLRGDRDVPIDMFPAIAAVFGYDTASGWLPKQ